MLFCTSIDDVVAAADCLCLSDHAATPTSHRHGLSQQAASLAIRGVHHANKQPSGARFQPLHKPAYFDVLKQQAELRAALLHDGRPLPRSPRLGLWIDSSRYRHAEIRSAVGCVLGAHNRGRGGRWLRAVNAVGDGASGA